MLDICQFAVQPAQALDANLVFERRGRQQTDTEVVGQHEGAGQTQLGVAVDGRLAAESGAVQFEDRAVFLRIDGSGTGAQDDVARLVGLGKGGGQCGGQDGKGEQGIAHGELRSSHQLVGLRAMLGS
ncbi:hypothetical protein D9M68_845070 [compost metagenome]